MYKMGYKCNKMEKFVNDENNQKKIIPVEPPVVISLEKLQLASADNTNVISSEKQQPDTKWKKRKGSCKTHCCLVFGLLTSLLGLLSLKFTSFDFLMSEKLKMTPGFPPFDWWLSPKPTVFCRVYVYTVVNPDAFLNGTDKKLKIKEFGPIIYKEIPKHSDVIFHENSTMTYTITRTVEFMPELNEQGILNKTITVPNIVLLGMVTRVNDYSYSVKFGFNMISKKDPVFINTTVYNYLWNISTPALETVKTYLPFMVPQDNGGLLHNIYESFVDRVNVRIGSKYGFDQFFMINTFNYRPTAPGYYPERGDCFASIQNSTEGAQYTSFMTKESVPLYWRKTVCKAVPLYYEKEVQKGLLKGYKYITGPGLYDRIENATADCYRGKGQTDLPSGLSDVSRCYNDFPVAVSAPHFYGRSGYWEDQLEGFSPSAEKHGSFAIIEPTTGVPLEQKARSQSNMIMPKLRNYNAHVNKFSELVVPMMWMEYHQEKLTVEITALVVFTANVLPYLQYVISVIMVLSGLFYIRRGIRRLTSGLSSTA